MYLLLFAVLMLLISTKNMASQVVLQKSLSILAFFCIFVMLLTLMIALANDNHIDDASYEASPIVFDSSGFGKAFATFVFAQLAHHGIPGIVELMADKSSTHVAFLGGVTTTCSVYLLLGQ